MGDIGAPRGSLRGTGFWLLWGNAVSIALVMSADRFTFEWLVGETLDASDLATGLVFFALGTPVFLFVLAAGAMADRHDRKRMLMWTQIGGAVVLGLSALAVFTDVISVPMTMVLAVCFGTVMAFAQPVRGSVLPSIVPRENLMHAIVVMTIGSNVAFIGGPLLAGFAISTSGVGLALAIQAGFFVAGVSLITRLHVPALPGVDRTVRLRTEVLDGLRFTWGHRRLRALFFLLSVGGGLMYGSALGLLPKITRDDFGRPADEAGLLFALMGGGMVVTSLVLIRHRHRITRRGLVFMVAMVFGTSNQVVQGFVPSYWWLAGLMFVWGMSGGFYANLNQTLIQELTPHEKMGRVMSLTALAQAGLSPLGAFGASALAQWIGARPAMGWLGAVSLVCVLGTLAFGRELRVQP
ncbi:MAG: MFS transporter [Ilumatobacter sp.]|nr:MFS transporter [Ilumatobacter sp.]